MDLDWCYIPKEGEDVDTKKKKKIDILPLITLHASINFDAEMTRQKYQKALLPANSKMESHKVTRESQKLCQNAMFLFKLFYRRYDYFGENMPLSYERLKEGLSYYCKQPKLSKILSLPHTSPSRGKVWPGNSNVAVYQALFLLNSLLCFML